jgi:hypothetical protein
LHLQGTGWFCGQSASGLVACGRDVEGKGGGWNGWQVSPALEKR